MRSISTQIRQTPVAELVRRRRLTVRARLALSYALLVTICGAVLITIVTVFMSVVPSYSFGATGLQIQLEPGVQLDPDAGIRVATQDDMLRVLVTVSVVALAVLALATAAVAWLLAGRMLQPLAEVNEAAKRAATGELDHRIGATGPRDEISELADTFDTMLAEIERSVEAHRRFAANASHELRTPLATTRTMLDVALVTPGGPDRALLTRLREVNERSVETVEALLDLAEIEGTGQGAPAELVDLVPLVAGEASRCSDLASAHDVTVQVATRAPDQPAPVRGSAVLLRQLVQNLVQNAVQHNVPGGSVQVEVSREGEFAVLRVSNTGAELRDTALERLLEPFARGEDRVGGGRRGLGLSIVRAIVARHGGSLALHARTGGGLTAEVRLPAG
ncbi:sensor histidine kinase [Leucobacter sp. HY1910]